MGCCLAASVQQEQTRQVHKVNVVMNQMMENQAAIVGQMASAPRVTATGDILVPMNYISGQFPTSYPMELEQYQITRETYSQFINELNEQKQAQTNMMNQAMSGMRVGTQGMNGMMDRMQQFQAQSMQIQQTLMVSTDRMLLKWNQSTFQPKGVQWESSLPSAAMSNTSNIGVILKKIQQQTVVVVQQPLVQTQAPPPYQQDDAPPPYQEGGGNEYTVQ